jgi:hypothetical protein
LKGVSHPPNPSDSLNSQSYLFQAPFSLIGAPAQINNRENDSSSKNNNSSNNNKEPQWSHSSREAQEAACHTALH